jgi:hypothetical protein
MVAFVNSAWMYNIKKLNNGEYPSNRKRLSVKYGFKCAKQHLSSLYCKYYVCKHLRTCGQYIVNREDVSHHCFMYLFFVSPFFIAYLILFYCIGILIIWWNGIIILWRIWKMWSQQCYIRHLHVVAPWDLPCRWRILRQDRNVRGVSSTM